VNTTNASDAYRAGIRVLAAGAGCIALATCLLLWYIHATGGSLAEAQECGTTSNSNCFTLAPTTVSRLEDGGQLPLAGFINTKQHLSVATLASGPIVTESFEIQCYHVVQDAKVSLKTWKGIQTDLLGVDLIGSPWDCPLRDRPALSSPDTPLGALGAGVFAALFFGVAAFGTRRS
jgi:hypothetical protein